MKKLLLIMTSLVVVLNLVGCEKQKENLPLEEVVREVSASGKVINKAKFLTVKVEDKILSLEASSDLLDQVDVTDEIDFTYLVKEDVKEGFEVLFDGYLSFGTVKNTNFVLTKINEIRKFDTNLLLLKYEVKIDDKYYFTDQSNKEYIFDSNSFENGYLLDLSKRFKEGDLFRVKAFNIIDDEGQYYLDNIYYLKDIAENSFSIEGTVINLQDNLVTIYDSNNEEDNGIINLYTSSEIMAKLKLGDNLLANYNTFKEEEVSLKETVKLGFLSYETNLDTNKYLFELVKLNPSELKTKTLTYKKTLDNSYYFIDSDDNTYIIDENSLFLVFKLDKEFNKNEVVKVKYQSATKKDNVIYLSNVYYLN